MAQPSASYDVDAVVRLRAKRGPRVREWMVTCWVDSLPISFDECKVRYVVYQQEIAPETKREHWQVYVEFYDAVRKGTVQRLFKDDSAHCEPRRRSRTSCKNYCQKKASAVVGTQFEWGNWRVEVNRKRKLCDILRSDMTKDQMIKEYPHFFVMYPNGLNKLFQYRDKKKAYVFRKIHVTVLVGPTGCGKTRKATSGPPGSYFMMPLNDKVMWYDGYEGEDTIIFDDFYGGIQHCKFLRLLDGYIVNCPIKGGFVYAKWTKVIITSNKRPCQWYKMGLTPELERRLTNNYTTPAFILMPPRVFANPLASRMNFTANVSPTF